MEAVFLGELSSSSTIYSKEAWLQDTKAGEGAANYVINPQSNGLRTILNSNVTRRRPCAAPVMNLERLRPPRRELHPPNGAVEALRGGK